MKVGFHSPLPPAHTGVADYSAALLRELRRYGSVESGAAHADVHLYHLGNNRLHLSVYQKFLARPGVAVFHDAVMHHFYLGTLTEQDYIEEFTQQYGEWHRPLAARLWGERAAAAVDHRYFAYAMLRTAARGARAAIVHNRAAAQLIHEQAPDLPVIEIPHLLEPVSQPHTADVYRFRGDLGIPPGATVFGVFGYLRESKRLLPVIETFLRFSADHPGSMLLLAGEFVSGDLQRAVAYSLHHPRIRHVGHLAEKDFWIAATAVDTVINLRDPAAAETSGIAIRMMGLGKPVILSDGLETASFPAGSCLHVSRGLAEQAELFEYMKLAVEMPGILREIGEVARQHVTTAHSLEEAARQYWETLCEYRG
jgi:glycosyltransferase involved in cell wall biosynthesis